MKKIVALLIALGILGVMPISFAQIDRRVDSFEENTVTSSYFELGRSNSIQFEKVQLKNGQIKYMLFLDTSVRNKNWMYSKENAKIKIDGSLYEGRVLSTHYKNFDYAGNATDSEIEITLEQVEKLKNAQKVSVRFYHENGLVNTIDVPDNVLDEWKQVINATK